ncbi:MAG: DUF1385 domain-containing protein [Chitinivibrionales bacterium]|nr:DUF1385 domain-containing protein [Chitinivibrionales bacterium]MBD3357148.1 DUF1385 domain-containing protein [Chitinivibrionales bacterium]
MNIPTTRQFFRYRLQTVLFLPLYVLGGLEAASRKTKIGGQAIIEGVMMRGKAFVSWAVRKASGDIALERHRFRSAGEKFPLLKKPVLRGVTNLFESLWLGLKALSRSAEIAAEEEENTTQKGGSARDKFAGAMSMIAAFALAFGLFLYLPMKILSYFIPQESAFLYNLLAGTIRIVFFLAYLIGISMWEDIRRVFAYHGAEHKAIHAYENGKSLTADTMRPYTTAHPRCGTSFLILVGLVCVFLFAIIDGVIIKFIGPYPNVITRTLVHLGLVPLVSGLSYEVLRFSANHPDAPIVRRLILPGLWLQRITTREPDDTQLGVAAKALEAVV